MSDPHIVSAENAALISSWLRERGGLALYRSIDLSNPGKTWTCPVLGPDGQPSPKPSWQSATSPYRIITDPGEVRVQTGKEVKRFRVGIQRGCGFSFTLTPGASRRVRSTVERINGSRQNEDCWYEFDYSTQEAVFFIPDVDLPLTEFLAGRESLSA